MYIQGTQNKFENIDLFGDYSLPLGTVLDILSFVDVKTIASSLSLVSKSWKVIIDINCKLDYFFCFYNARKCNPPNTMVDANPQLLSMLSSYALPAPLPALSEISKNRIRKDPSLAQHFVNSRDFDIYQKENYVIIKKFEDGQKKRFECPQIPIEYFQLNPGKWLIAYSSSSVFSIVSYDESSIENFNLTHLLGNSHSSNIVEEEEKMGSEVSNKRKGNSLFSPVKRKKIDKTEILDAQHISNTKVILNTSIDGQQKIYIVDLETQRIIDEIIIDGITSWKDLEVEGSLLMIKDNVDHEEADNILALYDFDERENKFFPIIENLLLERTCSPEDPLFAQVFVQSFKPFFSGTFTNANLLSETYVALDVFNEGLNDLYIYSIETCELNCVVRGYTQLGFRFIANHYLVFMPYEDKFMTLRGVNTMLFSQESEFMSKGSNGNIFIHNLLTGKQNSFSPQDFIPHPKATISKPKIVENNNTLNLIVKVQASQDTEYFEIPLGPKFEMGLRETK